jgi:hypothetical protein
MRGKHAKLILALLVGIAVGLGAGWTLGAGQGPEVTTIEGYTTAVSLDGTAIGLAPEPGDIGKGYDITGAHWREGGGPWQTSSPTCLAPLTSGQRVRLGVITVSPAGEAPGREIVVWVTCLA